MSSTIYVILDRNTAIKIFRNSKRYMMFNKKKMNEMNARRRNWKSSLKNDLRSKNL